MKKLFDNARERERDEKKRKKKTYSLEIYLLETYRKQSAFASKFVFVN